MVAEVPKVSFGGFVRWPRLSVDLPYPRSLDVCQSCGGTPELGCEGLHVWIEHDDEDQSTSRYLVLCEACDRRFLKPHPRLYDRAEANAPLPGAMATCVGCRHLRDLECLSPLRKDLGGPGLPIRSFGGSPMHFNMGRSRHFWARYYDAPPECQGREAA